MEKEKEHRLKREIGRYFLKFLNSFFEGHTKIWLLNFSFSIVWFLIGWSSGQNRLSVFTSWTIIVIIRKCHFLISLSFGRMSLVFQIRNFWCSKHFVHFFQILFHSRTSSNSCQSFQLVKTKLPNTTRDVSVCPSVCISVCLS